MHNAKDLAVEVLNLNVRAGKAYLVRDVSLKVPTNSICALIGESGSGKTTTALALLGYARRGAHIASGDVWITQKSMIGLPESELRSMRGDVISYVPQDPASALNPSMRIGEALRAMILSNRPKYERLSSQSADKLVNEALERIDLPASADFKARYPHQLSGGQQQRIAIGIAMACNPNVLIMDEPTTGLDVITERKILDEVLRLRDSLGTAIVYVTHDLRIANLIADQVVVLYGGEVVEQGIAREVLSGPKHPYTRALMRAAPLVAGRRLIPILGAAKRPEGTRTECAFLARCDRRIDQCQLAHPPLDELSSERSVRCFNVVDSSASAGSEAEPIVPRDVIATRVLRIEDLQVEYGRGASSTKVLRGVSLDVGAGESVGVLGLSGSGKSTLLRALIGLTPPSGGLVEMGGIALPPGLRGRSREERRGLGLVFQNPYGSLNPRRTCVATVARAAQRLLNMSRSESIAAAEEMLAKVQLSSRLFNSYPHQASGGERQRVAIAQALVGRPLVLLCDEVTSALDVSVQAAIVELLRELTTSLDMSLLFVTHDLGVVSSLCDRLYVLDRGSVVEHGEVRGFLSAPQSSIGQQIASIHASNSVR